MKTEEKTERQCGQRRIDLRVGLDAVLSIQKSPGPNPVRKSSQIGHSGLEYSLEFVPSSKTNAASFGSVMFLLESLILAQDERWRRA